MKKFKIFASIIMVLLLAAGMAAAADVSPSITLEWEQDTETMSVMTRWQLGIGTGPGTGYTEFVDVPKSNPISTNPDTYSGSTQITYTGTPGQTVTKYMKMRACIGPNDTSDCGGWSNEISHAVDIPIGIPGNLKKVSAVIGIKIVPIIKDATSSIEDDSNLAKIDTW